MEHVLGNLPPEVHWSIMKYLRHPVADIVSQSRRYKLCYYRSMSRKAGDAFDRGGADAYYWREKCPHKVVDRVRDNHGRYYDVRVGENDLTPEEIEAYHIGYDFMEHRK